MERRIRQTLAAAFDQEVADQARLDNLGGHASLRIYWRIHLPTDLRPARRFPRGESTLMAMVLPADFELGESAEGQSSQAATPTQLPFVDVQRWLADLGMPVPAIDTVDMDRGVLLIEDLGDHLFEDDLLAAESDDDIAGTYQEAIDLLLQFQQALFKQWPAAEDVGPDGPSIAFGRAFDAETLRWELDHYREWGLEAQLGDQAIAPFQSQLAACFDAIVQELCALPKTIVLRDFQSRNVMKKSDRWILIDFQDALVGPFIYDLVALLRDSYFELPAHLVAPLVAYYARRGHALGLPWCADGDAVKRAFDLQTVQRKLKDAGRFIYIDRVKNNPDFLDYYGPSIQYVRQALESLDDFDELRQLLTDIEPRFSK